ncbi:hypothetical protein AtNW77_Chr5g0098711 [Arabidopsis thaliana]|uniref:Uncharacterized protein n=4 Tax=Arabidopsis TaxID=3701 RepID=B3H4Y8_ARATH|nr:uncharacterized protein AT5G15008 [Arabidopsis thaliana]AED92103.1 hypothetical protein AT5G15008 [Arabidopsis thaliana]KAG7602291.1 hypothetical protein ISN45_At05g013780 [Arabidopsis thaliana x Arabidopsis arenosa]KAG7609240.1 hypothetical protein ISN44_As05g013730 [Arabidopsis suecica]CAA0402676.1 unnamed protein product [Arabidopsis thaliana]|eukprot:NP_001119226.1 hypothetical protein AT5G15008 [Arabidopsis thaliana]
MIYEVIIRESIQIITSDKQSEAEVIRRWASLLFNLLAHKIYSAHLLSQPIYFLL